MKNRSLFKKKIILLLSLPLLFPTPSVAAGKLPPTAANKPVILTIDGVQQKIPKDMGQVYIDISKDRTMIPVRFLSQALGFDILYLSHRQDGHGFSIVDKERKRSIVMSYNSKEVEILQEGLGKSHTTIDAPATVYDDRGYIPLRFVSEALGYSVTWSSDALGGKVDIERKSSSNDKSSLPEDSIYYIKDEPGRYWIKNGDYYEKYSQIDGRLLDRKEASLMEMSFKIHEARWENGQYHVVYSINTKEVSPPAATESKPTPAPNEEYRAYTVEGTTIYGRIRYDLMEEAFRDLNLYRISLGLSEVEPWEPLYNYALERAMEEAYEKALFDKKPDHSRPSKEKLKVAECLLSGVNVGNNFDSIREWRNSPPHNAIISREGNYYGGIGIFEMKDDRGREIKISILNMKRK